MQGFGILMQISQACSKGFIRQLYIIGSGNGPLPDESNIDHNLYRNVASLDQQRVNGTDLIFK